MAIQVRRGNHADFDPNKMLPGEWAVSIDSDTNKQIVWMCFRAGVVKRMGTYEDFKQQIADATGEIKEEYLAEFRVILDQIEALAEQTSTNTDTVIQIRDSTVNTYLPQMLEYLNGTAENAQIATEKVNEASNYARQSQSYAVGGTGMRNGEDSDNAKYYYENSKAIYENFSSAGSVTGVKGNAETTYRKGQVNLTAENVGALPEIMEVIEFIKARSNNFICAAYGNGKFVAIANNGVAYYSTDGITWYAGGNTSSNVMDIVFGNDMFVAVGHNYDATGYIYYSTDGITWNVKTVNSLLQAVTYADGKFVAVGYWTNSYVSADGISWTRSSNVVNESLTDVTYGNGKFVAAPSSGSGIYFSEDGFAWTRYTRNVSGFSKIVHGNGMFVALISGSVYYSEDSITWTKSNISGKVITFGNGKFISARDYNNVYSSDDGITWITISAVGNKPSDIVYVNDRIVIVGSDGIHCGSFLEKNIEEVILETKAKADIALQKENISQSTAITVPKQYALDAIEKNASVEGTLANQIASLQTVTSDTVTKNAITTSWSCGTVYKIGRLVMWTGSFVLSSDTDSNTAIATLPTGYRPMVNIGVELMACGYKYTVNGTISTNGVLFTPNNELTASIYYAFTAIFICA